MSDLVQRLSAKDHDIHVMRAADVSIETFRTSLERGHVHLMFPGTAGGTSLSVRLDPALTDLSMADFEKKTGRARFAGTAMLDYVRVQCTAEIALPSLAGTGRLETWADGA